MHHIVVCLIERQVFISCIIFIATPCGKMESISALPTAHLMQTIWNNGVLE